MIERICRTKVACPSGWDLVYYKRNGKLFHISGNPMERKEYIVMSRYLISEAARQTGVEAHVLRFWEEELKLEIPRNEQGHRYYTEDHIRVFESIKNMKLQGFQLKAIKDSLEQMQKTVDESKSESGVDPRESTGPGTPSSLHETEETAMTEKNITIPIRFARERAHGSLSQTDKLVEFESIVYDIVTEALRNNNEYQAKEISDRVGDKVVKEMNYLMRENEEQLEAHFRKLDEALRHRGRRGKTPQEKEAALTKVTRLPLISRTKKKRRLFPARRKTTIY